MFFNKINLENLSNKILYLLSQKSTVFKCLLIVLSLVFIFMIWLFCFARPLNASFLLNRTKLKQLNSLKNSCSQAYDQCSDLSQRIEQLDLKINKKLSIIGNSSAFLSLGKVIECINCNGVTLIDYSPGKVEKVLPDSKSRGSDDLSVSAFGKKVSFELTLEGTFLNMFNFFRCLSGIKYCLKYNQISINKNDQGLIGCKLILDILQVSK